MVEVSGKGDQRMLQRNEVSLLYLEYRTACCSEWFARIFRPMIGGYEFPLRKSWSILRTCLRCKDLLECFIGIGFVSRRSDIKLATDTVTNSL